MNKLASHKKAIVQHGRESGPWDSSGAKLREWDPFWAEQCFEMTTNPWTKQDSSAQDDRVDLHCCERRMH